MLPGIDPSGLFTSGALPTTIEHILSLEAVGGLNGRVVLQP